MRAALKMKADRSATETASKTTGVSLKMFSLESRDEGLQGTGITDSSGCSRPCGADVRSRKREQGA